MKIRINTNDKQYAQTVTLNVGFTGKVVRFILKRLETISHNIQVNDRKHFWGENI